MRRYSFWAIVLSALSITMCMAANLVSARLGFFGPWVAPMGVFFFPLIYVISDVLSDVYGYRLSRWVAWLTLACNLVFTLGILAVINVIVAAPWVMEIDGALRTLLTPSLIVLLAGIVGAVLGGWVNDIIFQIFRHKDGVAGFIKRKLLSSAAAEIVDTLVFITLAFKIGLSMPWEVVLPMYGVQFVLKYAVEFLTSPIAKCVAEVVRRSEERIADGQYEFFEDRSKFNIFGFERH